MPVLQRHGKWMILWSLWAAQLMRQPSAPVKVSNGLLRGVLAPDGSHIAYYGIPYATTDSRNRFQGPKPEPKWDGIFDAYNENIRCSQRFGSNKVIGREDCLTLNVYTPNNKNGPLPVMVFIHGGGFRDGSGSPYLYGPEYLIKHGVILVTFNYRVEILGFLCLGIKEAPGNVGLKDQVAAMRWIKKNIRVFGGDPDNITIFGESAGAAAVVYHLVSPMSKGLFNKAIMQSGSAMSPWSLQFEPLKIARLHAEQMGYRITNPHEIYNVYLNKTPQVLLQTRVPRTKGDIVLSENIFVPCIEEEIPGIEPFLTDAPYNLIIKGHYHKVPVIIGHNNAEGYMFAGKENASTISNIDFYQALPRDLVFPSEKEKVQIANTLRKLYLGDKKISRDTIIEIAKYEGDSSITFPSITTADLLSKTMNEPIYAYKMSYDGLLNFVKLLYGFSKYPGATHADELFYMFKLRVTLVFTFPEMEFINKLTTLWTNFAKYGDPTPTTSDLIPIKWERLKKDDPKAMELNKKLKMVPLWYEDTLKYWDGV
uniref:Carboxylic ester hydrolase n=2 Tax=Manduca sexta TaxID=7130 RepID=A0A977T7A5_MANSE|nr:esterase [Manduca sexta]